MVRPASPCPFYRMPCEYVPMAHTAHALKEENEKLRKIVEECAPHRLKEVHND